MSTTDSQSKMTTTNYTQERLNWLLKEIADLESYMKKKTLSASEQESLLKDWKYLQEELREVTEKIEEEETQDPNNWVDNREDCSRCSGCAYCMDFRDYDGADEI